MGQGDTANVPSLQKTVMKITKHRLPAIFSEDMDGTTTSIYYSLFFTLHDILPIVHTTYAPAGKATALVAICSSCILTKPAPRSKHEIAIIPIVTLSGVGQLKFIPESLFVDILDRLLYQILYSSALSITLCTHPKVSVHGGPI